MGDGYVFQTIAAPITGTSYKLAGQDPPGHDRRRPHRRGLGAPGPVEGIAGTAMAENVSRFPSTVRTTIAPDDRTAPIMAALLRTSRPCAPATAWRAAPCPLRVSIESPR